VHVTKNQQQLVAAKEGNIKLMRQQMEALRAAQKKMTQEEDRYGDGRERTHFC
jgi:hypothetical protein